MTTATPFYTFWRGKVTIVPRPSKPFSVCVKRRIPGKDYSVSMLLIMAIKLLWMWQWYVRTNIRLARTGLSTLKPSTYFKMSSLMKPIKSCHLISSILNCGFFFQSVCFDLCYLLLNINRCCTTYHSICGTSKELISLLGIDPNGLVHRINMTLIHRNHALWISTFAWIPPTYLQ